MKLNGLKEQHLEEIVRLFNVHCGIGGSFRGVMHQEPKTVLEDLKKDHRGEYAVMSKWSMRTKLQFSENPDGEIILGYYSNLDANDPNYEEAERRGWEFVEAAMKYLNQEQAKF